MSARCLGPTIGWFGGKLGANVHVAQGMIQTNFGDALTFTLGPP